jgi:hypothetical protein
MGDVIRTAFKGHAVSSCRQTCGYEHVYNHASEFMRMVRKRAKVRCS